MNDIETDIRQVETKIKMQETILKVSNHPAEFIELIDTPHPQYRQRIQEFLDCPDEMVDLVLHRMTVDVFTWNRRAKAKADLDYLRGRLAQLRREG